MENTTLPVVAHIVRTFLIPTETFVGNQIKYLSAFEPIVLCFQKQKNVDFSCKTTISASEEARGLRHFIEEFAYRNFRYISPQAVNALSGYAMQNGAEILHYHFLVDARFFAKIKERTGLPALVSAYGYDVSSFPKSWFGLGLSYLKPVFNRLDYFIAMSRDMKNDLLKLGCPERKIIIHYYGTDTQRFRNMERVYDDKEKMTIFVCGALMKKKAQHLTLEALRLVETKQMSKKKFEVVFVGDGPMRSSLERQVDDYGWRDKVIFRGHINHGSDELVKAYQDADIFSLPSITAPDGGKEGIPGTIVEAMASGLPVISSYHAGIPEIIDSGINGILVNEGDVEAMATNFADLLDSPSLRKYLGENASQKASSELDVKKATVNLEGIYRKILSGLI